MVYFYQPQGKVMFSEASVSHSVQRERLGRPPLPDAEMQTRPDVDPPLEAYHPEGRPPAGSDI